LTPLISVTTLTRESILTSQKIENYKYIQQLLGYQK
jgi:hypothetical protein